MTTPDEAAAGLRSTATLWSNGRCPAAALADAACDALVAGLDTPGLRELAAVNHRDADYDVPRLLPTAMKELGLTLHPHGSPAAQESWARLLAADTLAGRLTPRELADEIHLQFGHRLPPAETLASLSDEYHQLEYTGRTAASVDAEVLAEARRLAGSAGGEA
ncbi:hypothetical protein [Streptacidiphilus jiangxiensis]|nr:hypothetical protein [Streptacidiphilus jiangxiensis]